MKSFRQVTIEHAGNGIVVKVGCLRLVYQQNQLKQFFDDLDLYFTDSGKAENAIRKRWGIVPADVVQDAEETAPSETPGPTGRSSTMKLK